MKLAVGGNAPENMALASDVYSASNRQWAIGEHQGAALADLLQVAYKGTGDTPASDVD
jgi:hypothetical protein